jgi:hypothetical protein
MAGRAGRLGRSGGRGHVAGPAVAGAPDYIYGVSATQTGPTRHAEWYERTTAVADNGLRRLPRRTDNPRDRAVLAVVAPRPLPAVHRARGRPVLPPIGSARNADGLGPVARAYVYISWPIPPSEPTRIATRRTTGRIDRDVRMGAARIPTASADPRLSGVPQRQGRRRCGRTRATRRRCRAVTSALADNVPYHDQRGGAQRGGYDRRRT